MGQKSNVPATNNSDITTVKSPTAATDNLPLGRCRPAVRGFSASMRRSANRLNAMAALRPATMQIRMPAKCRHENATASPPGRGEAHASDAARSAKGSANTVWLKRIISRRSRTRPSGRAAKPLMDAPPDSKVPTRPSLPRVPRGHMGRRVARGSVRRRSRLDPPVAELGGTNPVPRAK